MRRNMVLTGLILNLGALVCAQDMTGDRVVVPAGNSSRPRVVKANVSNGSITVENPRRAGCDCGKRRARPAIA